MFKRIKVFLSEVVVELNKVSWPIKRGKNIKPSERYRELTDSTLMVIVSSVALAVYIGLMDAILSNVISLLIS